MQLLQRISACDRFGSQISLRVSRVETKYKTTGGGVATIALNLLMLAYFCLRVVAVIGYDDPQVS